MGSPLPCSVRTRFTAGCCCIFEGSLLRPLARPLALDRLFAHLLVLLLVYFAHLLVYLLAYSLGRLFARGCVQTVVGSASALSALAAAIGVSANDVKAQMSAHFQCVTEQLARSLSTGMFKLIKNLPLRLLWHEYGLPEEVKLATFGTAVTSFLTDRLHMSPDEVDALMTPENTAALYAAIDRDGDGKVRADTVSLCRRHVLEWCTIDGTRLCCTRRNDAWCGPFLYLLTRTLDAVVRCPSQR